MAIVEWVVAYVVSPMGNETLTVVLDSGVVVPYGSRVWKTRLDIYK